MKRIIRTDESVFYQLGTIAGMLFACSLLGLWSEWIFESIFGKELNYWIFFGAHGMLCVVVPTKYLWIVTLCLIILTFYSWVFC